MTTKPIDQPKISNLPPEKWQSLGNEFVKRSETILWGKDGTKARQYLHYLGLNDETVRKYRIGYNPEDDFASPENWGLPVTHNSKGNLTKIWLPRGIVVPCNIENSIRSIKIRRYLTPEQKSKGEHSDYSIKGSVFSLFGAENLRDVLYAVLPEDEFDAMLLDQLAGDLAGAASFGKPVKDIGAPDWVLWAQYLLHVAYILVPYTKAVENVVFTDSLSVYSRRTHRIYLPDLSEAKVVSDLKKVGVNPREWLIQAMSGLGTLEAVTNDNPEISLVTTADTPISGSISCAAAQDFAGDINPAQKWITINLNGPWLADSTIMPTVPCFCCKNEECWQRPDGGWTCSICHPNPKRDTVNSDSNLAPYPAYVDVADQKGGSHDQ